MQQPQPELDPFLIGLMLLSFGVLLMTLTLAEKRKLKGELEEQRRQRAHLENELEKREEQMNRALEHIHEHGDGNGEPAGE